MRSTIRKRLTSAFIGLSIGPLLLVGVVLAGQSFMVEQQQALNLQHEVARRVATQVSAFFAELENQLRVVSQVQGLQSLDREKQRAILAELLSYENVFEELILLDDQGQEQVDLARVNPTTTLDNRAEADEFVIPQTKGESYYSPVRFEEISGEPLMTIAIPLFNARTGLVDGVLAADLRLKKIWELIATVQGDDSQSIYIVDAQNRVVAHRNPSLVLQETYIEMSGQEGIQPGLTSKDAGLAGDTLLNRFLLWLIQSFTGGDVVLAVEKVHLGQQEFNVIAEQTVLEALALAINTVLLTVALVVATLAIAVTLGLLVVRQIVRPIQAMAMAAQAISAGELSKQVNITSGDELEVLAEAFNSMTTQLRTFINNLEQRVADRTQRLEIVATIGERLNAILDPADLLREVVNQIKRNFGYYHTQIYLLDDAHENLVVAVGSGSVGQEMVTRGHNISLQAAKSLVARTARTKTMVTVDDVQADPEWLSNLLLPETRAEMAVPILQEGEIIGVLDVQVDRVAGLDESDANLLRSLANQVAVALANARLFEQITRSKEEAEQARQEIEAAKQALEVQMWQTTGQTQLNDKMRGEQDLATLAHNVIQQVCKYLNAQVGTLYVLEEQVLRLAGSYAYTPSNQAQQFRLGEGLAGQAALEKQSLLVADVPGDYLTLATSLGQINPQHLLAAPFVYNGRVVGVLELGTLTEFSPVQADFLQEALESMAVAFTTAQARRRVNELLEETQQQAEILQAQEEELRAANEELESQAENLRASEAKLKTNQVELEQVNVELEEKAHALEESSGVLHEQRAVLDRQNGELKVAQQELERKAAELALASKYKSEFLANMSHELRTPLNSLLILAGMLTKNEAGNLTPDQVESVQIIHSGGTDLLHLINDILDLSKIEAGKIEFRFGPVALERLSAAMRSQFAHVAEGKKLGFEIDLADNLPESIETDQQRVEQVVKNLLSNAFKFTHQGSVRLAIYRPEGEGGGSRQGLEPGQEIAVRVSDTGIGMTPEQQRIVFEAFQQADSSTSRQYGGTGLGLSISRELVSRLGGRIELVSEKGQGSSFTLYLPIERAGAKEPGSGGAALRQAQEPERGSRPSTSSGTGAGEPRCHRTHLPSQLPTPNSFTAGPAG